MIWEANAKGKLSVASLLLLQACFGANDDRYRRISLLNHVVSKTQVKSTDGSAVSKGQPSAGTAVPGEKAVGPADGGGKPDREDEGRMILGTILDAYMRELGLREDTLRAVEKERRQLRIAATGLLPENVLNRLLRAEGAVERRFCRSSGLLIMLRRATGGRLC